MKCVSVREKVTTGFFLINSLLQTWTPVGSSVDVVETRGEITQ